MTVNDHKDDPHIRADSPGDDQLRARFAALRREEEAQAPEFVIRSGVGRERGRQRSTGQLIAITACVAAIAVAAVWLHFASQKPEPEPGKFVASITEWKAPTDFLLLTPGRELLRTVPTIGVWHDYSKAPTQKERHRQAKKPVLP